MNKDNRANRYSLKHTDINGNETVIKIIYKGKALSKLPLATIDNMTTKYANEAEFLKELMSLGYENGHLSIEYRAQGETRTIDVAYSDQQVIARESELRENAIASGHEEPKKSKNVTDLVSKIIDIQRNEKELWSYLQIRHYIRENFANLVDTFNILLDNKSNPNERIDYYYYIKNEIGQYREFRNIYMGIDEYNKIYAFIHEEDSVTLNNEVEAKTLEKKPKQEQLFNPDDYK